MRYFFALMLSLFVFGATACSPRALPNPLAALPESTGAPLNPAPAAVLSSGAAVTGRRLLQDAGYIWVGDPQPVLAQQMPFREAARQIPAMTDPEQSVYWPDTPVWLVVLRGTWDMMPMGPLGATLVPNRYQGCVMVLFTAQDSQIIAAGDTLCP